MAALSIEAACFTEHVKEGKALNKSRKSLYVEWASELGLEKEAKKASKAMIRLENLMIPLAKYFDIRAKKYEDIGLLCDEFVDIDETPEFSRKLVEIPTMPYQEVPSFMKDYKKRVKKLKKERKWEELREYTRETIAKFPSKKTHCLTRHFMESIGRVAMLAPSKIQQAKDQYSKDPSGLISSTIGLHLTGLSWSIGVDRRASKLQYKGIPIICQDVPHIPF